MMSDFETESRHKKYLNGIKNKWRAASCKYLKRVEYMKNRSEKLYRMRDKAFKKRYKEKEDSIQKQLRLKSFAKLKKKKGWQKSIKRKVKKLQKI
jgi:hypothetical protein